MAKKKSATKKKVTKKAASRKKAAPSKKTAKKTAKKPAKKPAKASKKASKVVKKTAKKATKKTAGKPPAAKSSAKKLPLKKEPSKMAPVKKVAAKRKKAAKVEEEPEQKIVYKKLPARELRFYKDILLKIRDQVVGGISFLAGDNLHRSQRDASGDLSGSSLHMADQGTDNFDREFALNLVSSEQDILYEIDEALQRIVEGSYGYCQKSGKLIEKERLKVIPYTRYCVEVQSEMERGRTRYRPFGPTLSHQAG